VGERGDEPLRVARAVRSPSTAWAAWTTCTPLTEIEPFRARMGWTIPRYSSVGSDGQALSVFVRDGDTVFPTYTTYGRGTEFMMSTYQLLDLTPMPRPRYVNEWPYHDTYGTAAEHACRC
jgi:predicted dithiol-disulfide oxidoreductase (DUF899 family)